MGVTASGSIGSSLARLAVLGLAVAAVSALHYLTDPVHTTWHAIFQRLYYVPLLLGAAWYGVRGGLVVALGTSVAYLPHVYLVWSGQSAYGQSQYVEIAMFWTAGLLFGVLFEARQRLTLRYQTTAASLAEANSGLVRSREELRQADRLAALGQMAAGLAHEIRNPLGGLRGALEIIESRVAAGTPEAEFAQRGKNELGRLERLVADFLAYARPRAPQLQRLDVHAILRHVVTVLSPQADSLGVALRLEEGRQLPEVVVDGQQIEQVLVNVLLNALQASGRDGQVRIEVAAQGPHVCIDVVDNGPGIPADQRDRVFEPFFTTKEKGTGLGLAVSARIVAAHGGDLAVVSQAGPGTRMRIRLPARTVGTPTAAATASIPPALDHD